MKVTAQRMKEATARRRQAEREERIRQILDAARTIFYREGYFGTTIRKIAHEAELSQGAIYRFFNGIDEIYAQLLLDQFQLIDAALEKAMARGASAMETIKEMMLGYFTYYMEYPESYDLFLFGNAGWRRVGLKPEITGKLDKAISHSLSLVESVVSRAMADGEIRTGDSAKISLLLWTAVEGLIVVHRRNLLESRQWDVWTLVQGQIDLLIHGIAAR